MTQRLREFFAGRRSLAEVVAGWVVFLLVCLLTWPGLAGASNPAAVAGQPRMVVAPGVRLRTEPNQRAEALARLNLGEVVRALTCQGSASDAWCQVEHAKGRGWVSAAFLQAYDPAQHHRTVLQLIKRRIEQAGGGIYHRSTTGEQRGTLADVAAVYDLGTREAGKAANAQARAELELWALHALQQAVSHLRDKAPAPGEPLDGFFNNQKTRIYYNEMVGNWFVKPEIFWDLHARYRNQPVGDDLAWEASLIVLPECAGDVPCMLWRTVEYQEGRYLQLYPQGRHADAALKLMQGTLDWLQKNGEPGDFDKDTFRDLRQLRSIVQKSKSAAKEATLRRIDKLLARKS